MKKQTASQEEIERVPMTTKTTEVERAVDMSRLKPLVWRHMGTRNRWESRAALSCYGVFGCEQLGFFYQVNGRELKQCDSIEHGKQLAQADYRQRVAGLFEG